jgi:arginine-tRNA-protein transferase
VSTPQKPRVIPPPSELDALGPLVVVDGECAYFKDGRTSSTAFALPGDLPGPQYQKAMDLGMRRSGTIVYRPVCAGCRKCQPMRVDVEKFVPSRSQKRVRKRCEGLFQITVGDPTVDAERLDLYTRYQASQHGDEGQSADRQSYQRFLVESVTDTLELAWRDDAGHLVAVGLVDVTPEAVSTVYFYWEPALAHLSLGVYSALVEIDLCRSWGRPYYYLGYLVPGSRTMSYKAQFGAGQVWNGRAWVALPERDLQDEGVLRVLQDAEAQSTEEDARRFRLERSRALHLPPGLADDGASSDE